MCRAFALLLAFLVGVLTHPVRAAVPEATDGVVLPGTPGDVALHSPRRETLAKGERAAVGGVERGTWDGDDVASLPTRHPPALTASSAIMVWRDAVERRLVRHLPHAQARGPPRLGH